MDDERLSVPADPASAERAQRARPWLTNCGYLAPPSVVAAVLSWPARTARR
jgi:hypothetical protein